MFCPKCGNKLKREGNKFCTYCGAQLFSSIEANKSDNTQPDNVTQSCKNNEQLNSGLSNSKVFNSMIKEREQEKFFDPIRIGTIFFLVVLLVFMGICYFSNNDNKHSNSAAVSSYTQAENNKNLYGLRKGNRYIFINKFGKEIYSLPFDDNAIYGKYNEGYVVIAHNKNESSKLCGMGTSMVASIQIFDSKGKELKVKNLSNNITYLENPPIFLNGVLELNLNENKDGSDGITCDLKKMYINKQGKVIEKPKNYESYDSYDPIKPEDTYQGITKFWDFDNKFGYQNKYGEIIIPAQFTENGSCDMSRNTDFYNGVAMVCLDDYCSRRKFMNTLGEYINNEEYTWAEPFYRELTFVATDYGYGYINTSGEWVYIVQ